MNDNKTNRTKVARKLRSVAKENDTLFAYPTKTLVSEYSVDEIQRMLIQAESALRGKQFRAIMAIER
jgi:hypothetical protein